MKSMLTEAMSYQVEPQRPRILDRLRVAIRRRHYSRRTEEAYVHWTERFIHFSGKRHPGSPGFTGYRFASITAIEQPWRSQGT
jgi:integrase-like protein